MSEAEISLLAILGFSLARMMKVRRIINNVPLVVLIDSGSTNDFLDVNLANESQQPILQQD